MIVDGKFLRHIAIKNKLKACYCTGVLYESHTFYDFGEMMTENRLTELEIKLAYQEDLLQELNLIVAAQQKQMHRLEETCKVLYERMKVLSSASELDQADHQPPPHY
jgi:SlyX protein